MQAPALPKNEAVRLRILKALDILDTPPQERYDRYTRMAKKMFDVPIALVSLVDENRQWFKSIQGLGVSETPRDVSFCGHTILTPEMMIVNDTFEDLRFATNPLVLSDPKIRFYAGCPLEVEPEVRIGTLCIIDSKPRDFQACDLESLEDFRDLIVEEMRQKSLATTDDLTGLSNRRGFNLLGSHTLELAKRSKSSITLFYIDLNKFKLINDTYGHDEGDHALKETGRIIISSLREMDVVGRMGGDEFCAACMGLAGEQVKVVEDRIAKNFQEHNFSSNKPYKIEYSLGFVTVYPTGNVTLDDLMKQADREMYQQKSA